MGYKLDFIQPHTDKKGNTIVGTPEAQDQCNVTFNGSNCRLTIDSGVKLSGSTFRFNADNSEISIGSGSQFAGMIEVGLESRVAIGQRLTVTKYCYISAAEQSSVTIGDDCMIASLNEIRADDSHPIFDIATGNRVNMSRPIIIGDHVWLAARSVVLSGSEIGNGAVLGHSAVLKGKIPDNSIAAGNPARVVREGIIWDRKHVSKNHPFLFEHYTKL